MNRKLPGSLLSGWKNRELIHLEWNSLENFHKLIDKANETMNELPLGTVSKDEIKKVFHRLVCPVFNPKDGNLPINEGSVRIDQALTAELEGLAFRCIDLLVPGRELDKGLRKLLEALNHIRSALP